ncbi:SPRY domain-containing SOCS box protein 3 [Cherax quadricarinatus]|uniref:SPRY domain-containing SOCS box protein 3 n=1 Tax=Cherax quadricarinatus TaxID=27406 RepID=UPI0023783CEE|nr:SPRY domain-containing SOCS box protein 3-like [Cherax quadricarinatus]
MTQGDHDILPQALPSDSIRESPRPLEHGCDAWWHWSHSHKSPEVLLYARTALFHPNWSHGTAAVRGSQEINGGLHYWEVQVSQRLFGTAVMFGVCTESARLHADSFVSLVGEDQFGWGLSHKGLIWHKGQGRHYTKPFQENRATTIGVLFDGERGTLGFYKDAQWLGVAFTGLNTVTEPLYPVIASTAAKTKLTLGATKRGWAGLQDRARHALLAALPQPQLLYTLPLPPALHHYLEDDLPPSTISAHKTLLSTDTEHILPS